MPFLLSQSVSNINYVFIFRIHFNDGKLQKQTISKVREILHDKLVNNMISDVTIF